MPVANVSFRALQKTNTSNIYYCYLYQLENVHPMPPIGSSYYITVLDNGQYVPGPTCTWLRSFRVSHFFQVILNTTSWVQSTGVTTKGCDATTSVSVNGQFWYMTLLLTLLTSFTRLTKLYSCLFLLGNGTLLSTGFAPAVSAEELHCNISTSSLEYLWTDNHKSGHGVFTLCNVTEEVRRYHRCLCLTDRRIV